MGLRDNFKATPTKQLKTVVENEDGKLYSNKSSGYLKIAEGTNKFRIFPKHPGEKAFYIMKGQHWITLVNDDGKEYRRTVNNSRIHAGTDKDIIEQYIDYCKNNLDATDEDDKEKIKALTNWEGGLGLQTSWLCYAKKMSKETSEFGLLELKKSIRDKMNQESLVEDDDEAMETDPFTDPDEGKPIIIKYDKTKKAKDMYVTTLSKNISALTDEELESFAKKTPLSLIDDMQYTRADFETALEGLRIFDEKNDVNLFDSEGFQEIVDDMSSLYDGKASKKSKSDDEEDEKPKKLNKKPIQSKKSSKKDEEEEEEDEVEESEVEEEDDDNSDIYEEEEEEEEEPPFKADKKKTSVIVNNKKKPVKQEEEDIEEEDEAEEEDEEEEEKPVKKPINSKNKDQIAAIKDKLANLKKAAKK